MVASVWKISSYDVFVKEFSRRREAINGEKIPLESTYSVLYFFGADSRIVDIAGKVFSRASVGALANLCRNYTTVSVTSDLGSEGNFKIVSFNFSRQQALNYGTVQAFQIKATLRQVS